MLTSVLLGVACSQQDPDDLVLVDLVELLPAADVSFSEVRPHPSVPILEELEFGDGWAAVELRDGVPFRWAVDLSSSIEFDLEAPGPLQLSADAWPAPGIDGQSVRVELNDVPIGRLDLHQGWDPKEYVIELPIAATVAGTNRLELVHDRSTSPADISPQSQDVRSLAAAWSGIRLEVHDPQALRGEQGGLGSLKLSRGDELAYYLRLPAPGTLRLGTAGANGGRGHYNSLELLVELESAIEPKRLTLQGADDAPSAELGNASDQPFKLTFRVSDESARGALIVAPSIAFSGARSTLEKPRTERRPNILIYVVDTLRADQLSSYGNPRPLTPHFDRLADEGVRFSGAVAQSSWTRPAAASILTGLDPDSHGTQSRDHKLNSQVPVLAELLQRVGYQTAAFSTNGNVSAAFGFDRGFSTFVSLPEEDTDDIHQLSDRLHRTVTNWIEQNGAAVPLALYVHASDPHYPYTPKPEERQRWAPNVEEPGIGLMDSIQDLRMGRAAADASVVSDLLDLYAAEVAFLDSEFGTFWRQLEWSDGRPWLVVLVGDHGEEFLDHGGWTHGETLYAEQLRVPLIIRFPDGLGQGSVFEGAVRQVDILPTVLSYVGAEVPSGLDGRDLTPALASASRQPSPAYASLDLDGWRMESVQVDGWKLIRSLQARDRDYPTVELYNLRHDSHERHNLAALEPLWTGYLDSLLAMRRSTRRSASELRTNALDEEIKRGLRALGYLN